MVKKDDRCFTFVVSRSSKNRIRIRRLEIPKRWLQTCAATLVASLGIISFNLLGLNHYSSDQLFAKQISGNLETKNFLARVHGEGGPDELNGNEALSDSTALQEKIRALEELFDKRASIPSIYPLNGKINNEFGMRRDPFGGSTYENHAGMDIDGDKGAPVIAPGDGVIIFAGWKGGYGNLATI